MSLNNTPLDPDANSYASVAEADDYLLNRRGIQTAAWATLTTTQKEESLIWATQILDSICEWAGAPRTFSQGLRWPRTGVRRKFDLDWLDPDSFPDILKDATAELAFSLQSSDRTKEPDLLGLGIASARVGVISVKLDAAMIRNIVPPMVVMMLTGLGEVAYEPQGDRSIKLVRS
jgi:hypothetical protein